MAGNGELNSGDARSEDERDRQMIELLNELRVALPGVLRRRRTVCASTRATATG